MIFVQVYGIYVYAFGEVSQVADVVISTSASDVFVFSIEAVLNGIFDIVMDVLPILAIIMFFHYAVLKQPVKNLSQVLLGFGFVVIGLYAFILGLEMGLFSLGESMAFQLTKSQSVYVIYAFGFAIGFATTMAEPALMAIAHKAKEISDGKIDDFKLRIFVAIGVAIGISLGAFRIVSGDSIHYYIIFGYLFVVLLTFIAPKYIIPIAFDSGGVTTSTVTVPLVAALGIGLASNIDGRNPLIDGFGLVAFASLFPMITVMIYGTLTEFIGVRGDKQLESDLTGIKINKLLDNEKSTVNINGKVENVSLNLSFSAIVAIVPEDKKDDAILAAKEIGAGGVTILPASGTGLGGIDNFYRNTSNHSDVFLLFIVPDVLSSKVVNSINTKLHLSTIGGGLVFAMPISHMRGISVAEEYLDLQRVKN
jgi:nitrogen regulatory protein PII